MKSFIYKCFIGGSVALSMTLSSCLGDLDLKPIDDNVILRTIRNITRSC